MSQIDPVDGLVANHAWAGAPDGLIVKLCQDLLRETEATAPVNVEVLRSYRGIAEVRLVDQVEAGCVFVEPDGRIIVQLAESDSLRRRRFTVCHEIVHTFFPGFHEEQRNRTDRKVGTYSGDDREEFLCDLGASELLFPREEFARRADTRPTITSVKQLADEFEATLEATAIRSVQLCPHPACLVVLTPALKPKELREAARRRSQPAFPGLEPEPLKPKLRVAWSYSNSRSELYVPKHKSVDEDCDLANVIELGCVTYAGNTGLVQRPLRVSAEYLPNWRGGEMVDRVLVLLAD